MAEIAVCNKCGVIYEYAEGICLIKKWKSEEEDVYIPCPNILCEGQLEIEERES